MSMRYLQRLLLTTLHVGQFLEDGAEPLSDDELMSRVEELLDSEEPAVKAFFNEVQRVVGGQCLVAMNLDGMDKARPDITLPEAIQ